MTYTWLLFDADGTLFDYDRAEATALEQAFAEVGTVFEPACLNAYREINARVWREFEDGRIGEVLSLLDNETGMHSCLESKTKVAGWHRRQEEASPCPREYRHRSGRARSLMSC
jgi:FMN phosphatase YigB (HAD superfamily)